MKSCLLAGVFLFLSPWLSASIADTPTKVNESAPKDQAKKQPPPCNCPLFELEYYTPYILYYCDNFQSSCEEMPDVGFHYSLPVSVLPYVSCHGDCYDASLKNVSPTSTPNLPEVKTFPGLPKKVPLNYMHNRPAKVAKSAPGTPRIETGVGVNRKRNAYFIKVSSGVFAKVLEFRCNRPLMQNPDGLTDAEIDGHWESRFVAYECENPAGLYEIQEVYDIQDMPNMPGGPIKRGKIKIDKHSMGELVPVLILLGAQNPSPTPAAAKRSPDAAKEK